MQEQFFDVRKFVDDELANLSKGIYSGKQGLLEKLSRKIDVFNRIDARYSHDFRKVPDSAALRDSSRIKLARIYLCYARENKDLKFINTFFNLLDLSDGLDNTTRQSLQKEGEQALQMILSN